MISTARDIQPLNGRVIEASEPLWTQNREKLENRRILGHELYINEYVLQIFISLHSIHRYYLILFFSLNNDCIFVTYL
jgi:hypothetical protein